MDRPFDISAFLAATGPDAPSDAERALLAHAAAGSLCQLSQDRPADVPGSPRIRAALLAHLITGGSSAAPVAPQGVRLIGAVIEGPLMLSFCAAQGETDLRLCTFTHPIAARRASFAQLVLSGSAFPGLMAEGASIAGSVFLIGVTATARISFATAQIGGQLALNGATIAGLTAQGARIGSSVYLRAAQGTPFTSTGEISLSGAEIGGQLACDGARLDTPAGIALTAQSSQIAGDVILRNQGDLPFHASGEVRLSSAQIGGQLDCGQAHFENAKGHALSAHRMHVGDEFFWQGVTVSSGSLHLPSAHVGDLVDDLASWPGEGRSYIDGFTYDRITRDAPVDAETRLAWLARCAVLDGRFLPQPYSQCAFVLHSMGHEAEARRIMEEQGRLKGIARRKAARARAAGRGLPRRIWASLEAGFDWIWDQAARAVVGYGFAPFRSLVWLGGLIAVSTTLSILAWNEGSMAPANDLIAGSAGWQALLAQDCIPTPSPGCTANPAAVWNGPEGPGLDWESFHPLAYGTDVVIPVVELGQTRSWSPSRDRGFWGFTLWWARWPLIALGWLVSALAAAAATGIIQRSPPGG